MTKAWYVEWLDSAAMHGWQHVDAYEKLTPVHNKTVGFLVGQSKDFLNLTASVSDSGQVDSPISIPKKAILSKKSFDLPNSIS
jgi:hypothetical protein